MSTIREDLVSRQRKLEDAKFTLEDEKVANDGFIKESTQDDVTAFYQNENSKIEEKIEYMNKALNKIYEAGASVITVLTCNYDADSMVAETIVYVKKLAIIDRAFYINPREDDDETGTLSDDLPIKMSNNIYEFGIVEAEEDMQKIIDAGKKIHFYANTTDAEHYSKYEGCIVDTTRSITKIAYDELVAGTECDDERTKLFVSAMEAYHTGDRESANYENGEKLILLNKAMIRKDGNDGARAFVKSLKRMWDDEKFSFTEEEEKLIEEEREIPEVKAKSVAVRKYMRI